MAEETINEVIERVQADLNETRSIGAHTPAVLVERADVKALLTELKEQRGAAITLEGLRDEYAKRQRELQAELETLRTERDALRAALVTIRRDAGNVDEADTPTESDEVLEEIYDVADGALRGLRPALNTPAAPPAAEWTPRVGQNVRIIKDRYNKHVGKRGQLVDKGDDTYWVILDPFNPGDTRSPIGFELSEIAPVDESGPR